MTREEAIKTLKGEAWICCAEKWNEALDMAIKSLEQESVLDKIKAEIETWHKEGTNWSDIRLMKIEDIINKYKAESEK